MVNYIQLAQSTDADERAEAARSLKAYLKEDAACAALIELSGDSDWRVRRAAVESFLEAREPETLPRLIEALYEEENAGKRNAALDILSRFGKEIVPFVSPHLNSPNADVRMFLLNILGDLRDPQHLEYIRQSLNDPETNVVSAAIVAFGKIGRPGGLSHILPFLHGENLWLKFQAIEAAAEMQDPAAIPILASLYSLPYCRKAVIKSLSRFQHPGAFAALIGFVLQNDPLDLDALQGAIDLYHLPLPSRLKKEEQQQYRETCRKLYGASEVSRLLKAARSADLATKNNLMEMLGWTNCADAVPFLIAALKNADSNSIAAQALIDQGENSIAPLLETLATVTFSDETALILNILNEIHNIPDHPAVNRLLSDDSSEIRYLAHKLVRSRPPDSANEFLIRAVTDTHPGIREIGLDLLLAGCKSDEALRQSAKRTFQQRLSSPVAEERANAVEFLALLNVEQPTQMIFQALKDEDSTVRLKAVRLLALNFPKGFERPLMAALADEDARVRELAAKALSSRLSPEVVEALLSSLEDEVIWVRIAIYEALSGSNDGRITATCLQRWNHETAMGQASLLRALGKNQTPAVREKLLDCLTAADPEIRKSACEALAHFDENETLFRLFSILQNDRDWRVRVAAIGSLTSLKPLHLQEALRKRLLVDQDPLVRKEILHTFQQLETLEPPPEVYEFLLDPNLSDAAYEFLFANRNRFAKHMREAALSQPPAVRHILNPLLE